MTWKTKNYADLTPAELADLVGNKAHVRTTIREDRRDSILATSKADGVRPAAVSGTVTMILDTHDEVRFEFAGVSSPGHISWRTYLRTAEVTFEA